MNCIDAIEGVLKNTLEGLSGRYERGEIDDMDYAQTLKLLIRGARLFLEQNPEIAQSPAILEKVLYEKAKNRWHEILRKRIEADAAKDGENQPLPDEGHSDYFFDFIFDRGVYPD